MSLRLRQVALAAHDLEATAELFCSVLDVEIAHRDPGVAFFGLVNVVIPIGDGFLEIVSPTRGDAAARRYLTRRGGDCGYMVMIQTDRFDADRARAEARAVRVVWQGEFPDIRGMHFHPRDTGGALLSLDEPIPAGAWRWAGDFWQHRVRTRRVSALRGVTVACLDPEAVAARWAALLNRKPTAGTEGPRLALDDGSRVRFAPAETSADEGVVAIALATRDREAVLAAARDYPLASDAEGFHACGIRVTLEPEA